MVNFGAFKKGQIPRSILHPYSPCSFDLHNLTLGWSLLQILFQWHSCGLSPTSPNTKKELHLQYIFDVYRQTIASAQIVLPASCVTEYLFKLIYSRRRPPFLYPSLPLFLSFVLLFATTFSTLKTYDASCSALSPSWRGGYPSTCETIVMDTRSSTRG